MSILDVIERARREPPFASPGAVFQDKRYVCKVFGPVSWERSEVERKLGIEIPPDLVTLWNACGGLILYEDNMHCQSGLVVLSPLDVIEQNFEYRGGYRAEDAISGDLVFAKFWGDLELALIRSDKNAADYGSITIVADMGPRSEWYKAAATLEEFLVRFMDAHGEKYWEYHYQKRLAERATEDLLRSRRVN